MDLPKWKPSRKTVRVISDSLSDLEAYHAFRSSSSAFISRNDVRSIVFNKSGNRCVNCGTENDLQIDHVVSVYSLFKRKKINECNSIDNLQVLCASCNASKLP